MKPLVINLQINVYPDGTVSVNPCSTADQSTTDAQLSSTTPSRIASTPSQISASTATGEPANSTPSSAGPSESDLRAALLAAVKASDKVTAVAVLQRVAGVAKLPEVPENLRPAVLAELKAIVAAAANESRGGV